MRTIQEYAKLVNEALDRYLPADAEGIPEPLRSAMRYSLTAGGKRLRPSLLLATVDMLGGDAERAMPYACALEMIHTYSLIHDDLPGMDGDTLRRGKPTNHVVFGEGQAILAGDALLSEAFELMLRYASCDESSLAAMREIAFAAGARGMVAGQCVDLRCEREHEKSEAALHEIHMGKTTRMLVAPIRAGARLAGASESELDALNAFAVPFGMLFQVTDDLLDVTGDAAVLGKSIGKDAESGKLTYVTFYGADGARAQADALVRKAEEALRALPWDTRFFAHQLSGMTSRVM